MAYPIRVFIVDDNFTVIKATTSFLTTVSEVEVVGYALSGFEAMERVKTLKPDLVLVDYMMPYLNGIEVTRQLKTLPDPPRVVIATMNDDLEYRIQAENAQADGFIAKIKLGADLLPLIATIFPNGGDEKNTSIGCSNEEGG